MGVSTYLSLRHDIEVALVNGEGHVPEDGAPIFEHRDHLILDPSVRGTVGSNLWKGERILSICTQQSPVGLPASAYSRSLYRR